jgi:hypothetical protein
VQEAMGEVEMVTKKYVEDQQWSIVGES